MINPELLNTRAHVAKHVLLLVTLRIYRDPSDASKSLIISRHDLSQCHLCIICTVCKKLYIGETGRRLGDRFQEHLHNVEKNNKNASKPVARHFNFPNHSKKHIAGCGFSIFQGRTESRETLEQKFILQIGTLNPHSINECFSFN